MEHRKKQNRSGANVRCLSSESGGNWVDQLINTVVPLIIDGEPAVPAKMRF